MMGVISLASFYNRFIYNLRLFNSELLCYLESFIMGNLGANWSNAQRKEYNRAHGLPLQVNRGELSNNKRILTSQFKKRKNKRQREAAKRRKLYDEQSTNAPIIPSPPPMSTQTIQPSSAGTQSTGVQSTNSLSTVNSVQQVNSARHTKTGPTPHLKSHANSDFPPLISVQPFNAGPSTNTTAATITSLDQASSERKR